MGVKRSCGPRRETVASTARMATSDVPSSKTRRPARRQARLLTAAAAAMNKCIPSRSSVLMKCCTSCARTRHDLPRLGGERGRSRTRIRTSNRHVSAQSSRGSRGRPLDEWRERACSKADRASALLAGVSSARSLTTGAASKTESRAGTWVSKARDAPPFKRSSRGHSLLIRPSSWIRRYSDGLRIAGFGARALDGIGRLLPRTDDLLYSYVRKEAVLSSQI
jgi:hypothetical protein